MEEIIATQPQLTPSHPEASFLMFIVAEPSVFSEYHTIPTNYTTLSSGKLLAHVSHCGTMMVRGKYDARIIGFTQEDLLAYLDHVDDYATENYVFNIDTQE